MCDFQGGGQPVWAGPKTDPTVLKAKLGAARSGHTATLLPDGSVLVFGGLAEGKAVVRQAEVFDPATQSFITVPLAGLTPRAFHTATLLTDGRVLIAGGIDADGETLGTIELWDFRTGQTTVFSAMLHTPRSKHTATLQPDGTVLLWGGVDANGTPLSYGEAIDPQGQTVQPRASRSDAADDPQPARLQQSLPENGASDVPLNLLIALRFSKPLRVETVNANTVVLSGPQGNVAVKVVPAEAGMLAFITPLSMLQAGTAYTLSLEGLSDDSGQVVPDTTIVFTTAGQAGNATTGAEGGTGSVTDAGAEASLPAGKLPAL